MLIFCWLDSLSSVVGAGAGAGGWWGSKAVPGGAPWCLLVPVVPVVPTETFFGDN
ncbi:hypothetical protein HanOQP8_Chr16g0632651 [Helianthus annuus]|nr:hypothetical protein HanHA89_Chr16g0677971 [Helianthus annuus]KAJ0646216.1 hypothetical protein HanOQP8_Chr16g0632651 [Helianthus annuus]